MTTWLSFYRPAYAQRILLRHLEMSRGSVTRGPSFYHSDVFFGDALQTRISASNTKLMKIFTRNGRTSLPKPLLALLLRRQKTCNDGLGSSSGLLGFPRRAALMLFMWASFQRTLSTNLDPSKSHIIFLGREQKHWRYLSRLAKRLQGGALYFLAKEAPRDPNMTCSVYIHGTPLRISSKKLLILSLQRFGLYKLLVECSARTIDMLRPRAVLIPEGTDTLSQLFAEVAITKNKKVGVLQWGAPTAPFVKRGLRHLKGTYLCWGPAFESMLKKYNPKCTFHCVGHLSSLNLEPSSSGLTWDVIYIHNKSSPWVSERWRRHALELIRDAAEKNPNISFVVKPHPNQPLSRREQRLIPSNNNIFICNATTPLESLLHKEAIVVTIDSTASIEAAVAYGCQVTFFRREQELAPYQKQMIDEKLADVCTSKEDTIKNISVLGETNKTNGSADRNLSQLYFKAYGNRTEENIISWLSDK